MAVSVTIQCRRIIPLRNLLTVTRLYASSTAGKSMTTSKSSSKTTKADKKTQISGTEMKTSTASDPVEDGTTYQADLYYQHHPMTYNDFESIMRQYRLEQPSSLK